MELLEFTQRTWCKNNACLQNIQIQDCQIEERAWISLTTKKVPQRVCWNPENMVNTCERNSSVARISADVKKKCIKKTNPYDKTSVWKDIIDAMIFYLTKDKL